MPVVVLTSSPGQQEFVQTENLHVEAYLTKPVDLQQFDEVVKSLRKYMLSDVILPS